MGSNQGTLKVKATKTRLYKTDIANFVLKDTKDTMFNLQVERVYIRNIEYIMPKQQAYAFLSKYVFPTTLTNPQKMMVSSCFEEYLNYANYFFCKTEDNLRAEQSKSLVIDKTKLFHNNSNLL
jgi:hypothetical protein